MSQGLDDSIAGTTLPVSSTDDNPITHDVGDDSLLGSASDDVLSGHDVGDDSIDGGSGHDTLEYLGDRADYTLTPTAAGFVVEDHVGTDGRDSITNIERLQFADDRLALDVDGNAGTVAKVLGAVFGSASIHEHPEYVGIGLSLLDGGMSYEALMQLAIGARLGAAADDHGAVVDLLYTNVVGTAPPTDDRASFVKLLDDHSFTVATLGVFAADTSLNQEHINLVGLAQTGIDYVV